jgi:hypothetical protein
VTWQPINLAEVGARRDLELLAVAAAGRRIYIRDGEYSYDNVDSDEFEGWGCTDEVYNLIRSGLLTDRGGQVRITDAGRAHLAEARS